MTTTGRLAVLKQYGKPLELEEFVVPDPAPGAIIVRITQSSICGSDMHMWRQDSLGTPIPPGGRAMGHEGTGTVYRLGHGVTTDSLGRPIAEGDRLIHSVIVPCNSCRACLRGDTNLCQRKVATPPAGSHPYFVGTFADYYYIGAGVPVFKVPDELSDDVLAPVNCAMGTVTQGLMSAGVGEGQCVVLQGAGGLGLSAAAMAKDMGAHKVIVLDQLDNRLALAREFGADHTINVLAHSDPAERIEMVREMTAGQGADVVMELVGSADLVPEGIAMLRPGGTYVDIGLWFSGRTFAFDPSTIVMSAKRVIGSAMYRPGILPLILDFLVRTQHQRPFDRLISHRFALDDINLAFDQSEWDKQQTPIVRAVLVP